MLYTLYLNTIPLYIINQDGLLYYRFKDYCAYQIGENISGNYYTKKLATPEQIALLSDEQVLEYL